MSLSVTEICLAGMVVALLLAVVFLWRRGRPGGADEALLRSQLELSGRLKQLAEQSALEQDKIARAIGEQKLSLLKLVDEKLLQMAQNVGEGLRLSGGKTEETLAVLRERLAKIDVAQQKITSLSEQVVSLQEILSNKQARGAFGEIQLTDAIKRLMTSQAVYSYDFEGTRYDVGDKFGFIKATIDFALDRADLREAVAAYIKEIAPKL